MEKRVVITGMGIWSCLGNTLDEVRDALYKGKSGIVFSQERKDLGFRSALCAKVEHPDLKPFVSRNLRQFMPEEAQYAYMATRAALADAKLEQDYIDSHEIGIIYGNDSVAEATMRALDKFREFHLLYTIYAAGIVGLRSRAFKPNLILCYGRSVIDT